MSTLSSTATTGFFFSWCCFYYAVVIGSSVSGFATTTTTTTTSSGATNYSIHRNGERRPSNDAFAVHNAYHRRRRNNYQQQQQAGTALHLSFLPSEPPFVVSDLVSTYAYCLKYHYFPTQSITNAVITVVGDGIAQSQEQHSNNIIDNTIDGTSTDSNACNNDDDNDNYQSSFYDPKRGLVYFFKGLGSGVLWASWFDTAEVWSMELTQSVFSHTGGNGIFELQQPAMDFAAASSSSAIEGTTEVLSAEAQGVRTAINILSEQFLVCPVLFTLWDIPVTSLLRGSTLGKLPSQIREKLGPLLMANAKVWTLVNVVTYNIPLEYRLLFTSAASIVSESINAGITSQQPGEQTTTAAAPLPPPLPPFAGEERQPQPVSVGSLSSTAAAAAASAAAAVVVPLASNGGIGGGKNTTLRVW